MSSQKPHIYLAYTNGIARCTQSTKPRTPHKAISILVVILMVPFNTLFLRLLGEHTEACKKMQCSVVDFVTLFVYISLATLMLCQLYATRKTE
jgi:hypothetical protein